MLQLKLETHGFDALFASLGRLEQRIQDLHPAMQEVGAFMLAGIRNGFAHEGSPSGLPWRQLVPETANIRQAQGFGPFHPILERSGQLKNSFHLAEALSHSVTVGSELAVAGYHQTGYRNGSKQVGARPMAGLPPEGLQGAANIILRHLHETL